MGKQKSKKGPSRKLPKRRSAEARALQEPQYRQRRDKGRQNGRHSFIDEPMWGDQEDSYAHRREHRND